MGKIVKNKIYGVVKRKKKIVNNLKPKRDDRHIVQDDFTNSTQNEQITDTNAIIETEFCTERNTNTPDQIKPDSVLRVEGRRIVDFQFLIDQLIQISRHSQRFGCHLDYLKIVDEKRHGLKSIFSMNCSMCGNQFKLKTSQDEEENVKDVNHSAVLGTILIGCGLTNFNELAVTLQLPILTKNLYSNCHKNCYGWWKTTAEATMKDAAAEETEKATEKSSTGIPMIAVTADACWSKRSYKSNYSSLAGVGAIIGLNSGKVLHISVKNKYCVVCARNKNNVKPAHECNINHLGSSTSMEQTAIVEGFKKSEKEQNLIYFQLVADGDASTFKNILESRPYPNVTVQKIECCNHLMRNYNGKNLKLVKDTSIPIMQRKLLSNDRVNRLRVAIKAAVRFRKAQNLPSNEAIKKLRNDILNSPKHVFGDHQHCEDYYCTPEKKNERNLIPHSNELMLKLMAHASALSNHAQSLLHDVNNNRAEHFNAKVAKYIGGKRINFALKDSYSLRCYVAVVAHNTGSPISSLHKTITQRSPSVQIKKFETRKRLSNATKKIWKPKRRLNFASENADYGELCQKPDMTEDEYERVKALYLEHLKAQLEKKEIIERETVLQAESALWLELRRCLVTASNFAKVCKRRNNLSSAPLVKTMLYSYSLDNISAIQHGKNNEAAALEQLSKQENIKIVKCGLHIDAEHYFLGATPDAVYDDGIIEIKCPQSAFGMDPEEAIRAKKIKIWKIHNSTITLNKNNDWYYQIQGQLHITEKPRCLFAVWTGPEHNLKTEIIERDEDFWKTKMEEKLLKFYHSCLLPEILDSRKARSMPLRNTVI